MLKLVAMASMMTTGNLDYSDIDVRCLVQMCMVLPITNNA